MRGAACNRTRAVTNAIPRAGLCSVWSWLWLVPALLFWLLSPDVKWFLEAVGGEGVQLPLSYPNDLS